MTALPVTAPAPCAIEACGDALSRRAAELWDRKVLEGARRYRRTPEQMRRLGLAIQDSWCAEHNRDDPFIRRAIVRRMLVKLNSVYCLRPTFPHAYNENFELTLWQSIAGELLAREMLE